MSALRPLVLAQMHDRVPFVADLLRLNGFRIPRPAPAVARVDKEIAKADRNLIATNSGLGLRSRGRDRLHRKEFEISGLPIPWNLLAVFGEAADELGSSPDGDRQAFGSIAGPARRRAPAREIGLLGSRTD